MHDALKAFFCVQTEFLFDEYEDDASSSKRNEGDDTSKEPQQDVEYKETDESKQECSCGIIDKLAADAHELQRLLQALKNRIADDVLHYFGFTVYL